ncbi:hypothetical protein P405_26330 [Streptomyces sp. FR-008]|nr:hypothetical protein P405_26330 [Streptomyces sp. FR-008]
MRNFIDYLLLLGCSVGWRVALLELVSVLDQSS